MKSGVIFNQLWACWFHDSNKCFKFIKYLKETIHGTRAVGIDISYSDKRDILDSF